jgi:ribosomal protein S18 acetylase RimI-like enzyme
MTEIRKAEKKQAAQIVGLLEYIFALHKKGRPDVFADTDSPKYTEEDVCRLIDDENYRIISAEEDGRVVGYMIAELVDGSKHPHMRSVKTLYIDDICVDEAYAHKGVGTALFEEAKRIGKELGCVRIDLNVWAFNEGAIKFYEKMGMTVSSMRMEYKLN